MRTHDEIEQLAAAGRRLLPDPASLVGAEEEDRILERILESDRRAPAIHRRRRAALALAGVAVLAVAGVLASVEIGRGTAHSTRRPGHHHLALTGPTIRLAGYRFKTPAGFKPSTSSCISTPVVDRPRPTIDGFAAAASAEGGCVEAAVLVAADWLQAHGLMPDAADAVDVGRYTGYFVPPQASGKESTLYVKLPGADGPRVVFLVLVSRGLTEAQLIAVAESGLPTLPPAGPTPTTGTEPSG